MSQNVAYHDNRAFAEVMLTKGDHAFRIDYKNDCNFGTITLQDYNAVVVRVDYL